MTSPRTASILARQSLEHAPQPSQEHAPRPFSLQAPRQTLPCEMSALDVLFLAESFLSAETIAAYFDRSGEGDCHEDIVRNPAQNITERSVRR